LNYRKTTKKRLILNKPFFSWTDIRCNFYSIQLNSKRIGSEINLIAVTSVGNNIILTLTPSHQATCADIMVSFTIVSRNGSTLVSVEPFLKPMLTVQLESQLGVNKSKDVYNHYYTERIHSTERHTVPLYGDLEYIWLAYTIISDDRSGNSIIYHRRQALYFKKKSNVLPLVTKYVMIVFHR